MNTAPLMFSTVTGCLLAVSGAALATNGMADWGLFTVGAGILALALASWVQLVQRPVPLTQPVGHVDQAVGR